MMEKMIFGRYVPAKSILHQMDPRAKLLFILDLYVSSFWLIML